MPYVELTEKGTTRRVWVKNNTEAQKLPMTLENKAKLGYRRMEEKGGRWESAYSKTDIKRTWGI